MTRTVADPTCVEVVMLIQSHSALLRMMVQGQVSGLVPEAVWAEEWKGVVGIRRQFGCCFPYSHYSLIKMAGVVSRSVCKVFRHTHPGAVDIIILSTRFRKLPDTFVEDGSVKKFAASCHIIRI
jgi:hypothetical protein